MSKPHLSAAEWAALKFLDAQIQPLNAYSIGEVHIDAILRLANMRVGRRKLVSQRVGRQGFTEWRIADAGREMSRALADGGRDNG